MVFDQEAYDLCDAPGKTALMLHLLHHYERQGRGFRLVYFSETAGQAPDLRYWFADGETWEYHEVHWRLGYFGKYAEQFFFEEVRWPYTRGRIYVLENFHPLWCWCPNEDFSKAVVMRSELILEAPVKKAKTTRGWEDFYHIPRHKTKLVNMAKAVGV